MNENLSSVNKTNIKITREQALALKKQTLTAWTKILLNSGKIDFAKCSRMISMIEKLPA